ncbi:MAG: NADH-quinone oxidoreductase subunit N [Syntrophomonadaceae bacterium]|nr:NADH-quinone oxidoreductase subunit N [Syntrophomonadaceae bacterium]
MMYYQLLGPEITVAVLGLLVLAGSLLLPSHGKNALGYLTTIGLAAVLLAVILNFSREAIFFAGVYQIDMYANFFRLLFLSAALLIMLMSSRYTGLFGERKSEWFSFMLFATLGMMIMVAAGDLIMVYVGLELMTISFYILTAYLLNDRWSAEAGLKYLLIGAMSSAVLLFGMSLIYACSGSTVFTEIYQALLAGSERPALLAGIVMMMAGLGFKISVVPFHMWTPDIYQGAPTPVTAYLAVASKAAGFAVLVRILLIAFPPTSLDWKLILAVLAALTIIIGNLTALPQTNVKRMLAYSSIAQAGYILVGLVAANTYGLKGVLFYAMTYVFANVAAFAVTAVVEVAEGNAELESFNGLGRRAPMPAAVMTICLLSLAGIPPMAGFAGKLYLFSGAIQGGYLWLAFIGLLMSMISVYYYLHVAKAMYIGISSREDRVLLPVPVRIALWICLLGTILMGVYPGPLSELTELAVQLFSAV